MILAISEKLSSSFDALARLYFVIVAILEKLPSFDALGRLCLAIVPISEKNSFSFFFFFFFLMPCEACTS